MPAVTRIERAAIAFEHLTQFVHQVELHELHIDTVRLRELLIHAISMAASRQEPKQGLLLAALAYVHAEGKT